MPKQNVEIYLKSLFVKNNGVLEEGKEGDNALTVELIHPTTGRGTVLFQDKDLKLKDKGEIDFETALKKDTDQLKYDEFDRLMFKEEILNKTKLDILLTHTEDVKEFDIFLTKVFTSLINLGGGLLPGVVAAISGAVKEAALEIKGKKEKKDEKIYIIGKASRVLSLDDKELKDLKPGESTDISINLAVPQTVTKNIWKYLPPDVSEKPQRVPEVVIEKTEAGDFNATLTITVKFVE